MAQESWGRGPYCLISLLGKSFYIYIKKKSLPPYLCCWFYLFPWSSHIYTVGWGWGRGCILLKVRSWAKNSTLASYLSAHFWTMLPQEGTFENSSSLPSCNQAVPKHMINEWSWLSDSALGWLSCESGSESWVVGSTHSLNKHWKISGVLYFVWTPIRMSPLTFKVWISLITLSTIFMDVLSLYSVLG